MDQTLTMIKPDSMEAHNAGNILAHLEQEGFQIQALKRLRLSKAQAQSFYAVHQERPFYDSLVAYMTSGPIIAVALTRENAVPHLRQVMGATDPAKADEGTLRKEFATNVERNIIHGSDSPESSAIEISYFFNALEITSL